MPHPPHSFHTLIAGAGPAGCAAAYDLAQAGRRVLLLDTRTFPRPKACACGLTRKTLTALRYSVEPIVERRCHEIVLQQTADTPAHREVRIRARNPIAAMAVRSRFDHFCLQQTLAAGRNGGSVTLLKIETILTLKELPATPDLPAHVELTVAPATGPQTFTAPIFIGADGSNGQTRRLFPPRDSDGQALSPSAQDGFALEATIPYATLPATLPQGDHPHDLVFDFAPIPGGYGWLFPKADHINIGVGAFAPSHSDATSHIAQLKSVTRKLLAQYTLHKLGVDITTLPPQTTTITGQHLGMGGHRYTPTGRILLTGDAAGLVDPLTGEGIHSAITSGQAAAAAILETLPTTAKLDPGPWALDPAQAYARNLAPLQQTLAFSHRAAQAFYRQPSRGFRVMRTPFLRGLVLKTYADGLPHTRLLARLAKLVA